MQNVGMESDAADSMATRLLQNRLFVRSCRFSSLDISSIIC